MLKVVKTKNGYVRGIPSSDPRVISFKGIPFAAPPVGKLRWCPPKPAGNWEGVLDCLEFAPISMQNIPGINPEELYSREWNVDPEIPMDEDCLYLNIWTPAKNADDKLPVYVWFFGGAFQFGNTAEMEFDGERLARRGIVVVTVNYRLNVFGFFAHPELTREAPDSPTNFGCLDQQYGLLWTRQNIAAFGGDPDNITIGGQSAGGGSVLMQLNCPENEGCIKKAVIESGMFENPYQKELYPSLKEAEKKGEEFFQYLGVKTLEEARALPASYIRDKNQETGWYWWPVIDGVFQKQSYMKSLLEGSLMDIPIFIGYTADEFWESLDVSSEEELVKMAKECFGGYSEAYLDLVRNHAETFDKMLENSRVQSVRLALKTALHRWECSGKKQPVYCYRFNMYMPGFDDPGVFHSSELWFFFETLLKCWRPFVGKHYDLSRIMCSYLGNFISDGDPNGSDRNGKEMPKWETTKGKKPKYLELGENIRMESFEENELEELLEDWLLEKMNRE